MKRVLINAERINIPVFSPFCQGGRKNNQGIENDYLLMIFLVFIFRKQVRKNREEEVAKKWQKLKNRCPSFSLMALGGKES